jgi:hypothetical protein
VALRKLNSYPGGETVKICRDYSLAAIENIASVLREQGAPFRFVYIGGHFAPGDRSEIVKPLADNELTELALIQVPLFSLRATCILTRDYGKKNRRAN